MAEVIGVVSGVLTLVISALKTTQAVYDTVTSFKSQRKTIQDVQTDLGALIAVLELISQQIQASETRGKFELLRQPIECCTTTCQEMQDTLSACMKHAKGGGISVRDWINMRYRGKDFEDIKQRLASYKSTLSITFASINIQDRPPTQEWLREHQCRIEGTKDDVEDQLNRVEQAIIGAEASLRDVLLTDRAQLQKCLESLALAQKVADTTRPQIVIERNRAGQDSRALFGTDTCRPEFNLTVSQNDAEAGATMAAGVHSPATLQALLKESGKADLAGILQTLSTQPPTSINMLRSLLHGNSASNTHGTIDGKSNTNTSARWRTTDQEASSKNVEMLASDVAHG